MTTLLLVEDHASFREALQAVIAMEDDLTVVAHVDRGEQAGQAAAEHRPDVAVVDLDLPGVDGIEAVRAIRRNSPGTACLVLTALRDEVELGRAVQAGAAAILHKAVEIQELLAAIRRVASGATLLSPADMSRWLQAASAARDRQWLGELLDRTLSPREKEVLELLAQGGTSQAIAAELNISVETVQTHVRNVLAKLDVRSRLEAVAKAIRLGLVDPPS
ncbi:MAG TPA: response regulator transcription factor [Nitriliruptorales bacterium]|nr:response regulator transcription factor [Nitriliruptorales bacterium]